MVDRLVGLWRRLLGAPYASTMGIAHRGPNLPVTPPPDLANYHGLWVAVHDGKVVEAAETPKELVFKMRRLNPAVRREAVMQKAHAPSGAVVIGMG